MPVGSARLLRYAVCASGWVLRSRRPSRRTRWLFWQMHDPTQGMGQVCSCVRVHVRICVDTYVQTYAPGPACMRAHMRACVRACGRTRRRLLPVAMSISVPCVREYVHTCRVACGVCVCIGVCGRVEASFAAGERPGHTVPLGYRRLHA